MTTRPAEQIQRAHDLLVPILTGEIKVSLPEETKRYLHCAADVLCWCLNHDHNEAFAGNLEKLEQYLEAHGLHLENHGN